jgi:hypothetical protein
MNESFHGDDGTNQGCNVQVAVRCRPMSEDEEKRGLVPVVTCDSERKQIKVGLEPWERRGRMNM